MEKKSGNKWYVVLFGALIASSIFLVVINVVSLVLLPLVGKVDLEYSEVAIQNIVSIFGIAVSVWIGLGIVDRMDRVTVMELQKRAERIEEEIESNERLSLQFLLDDLQADRTYAITHLIFEKIKDIDAHDFSNGVWRAIHEEERVIHELQKNDKKFLGEDIYIRFRKCIKNIEEEIKKQKNSRKKSVESINEVRALRKIQARFLMGYRTEEKKAHEYFVECVEHFYTKEKYLKLEKVFVPKEDMLDETEIKALLKKIKRDLPYPQSVYAYIFNFIGESFSKIVWYANKHGEKKSRYPKGFDYENCKCLAVNYCLLSTRVAEQAGCQRETYYRNYGCALERVNKKKRDVKYLESAIEQYRKALELDSNKQKVYHCLTSAYNKIFEIHAKIDKRRKGDNILQIEINTNGVKKEFFDEYRKMMNLYLSCFPQEIDAHIMAALFYRNNYLWSKSNKEIGLLKKELWVIELMSPKVKDNKVYIDGINICNSEGECF